MNLSKHVNSFPIMEIGGTSEGKNLSPIIFDTTCGKDIFPIESWGTLVSPYFLVPHTSQVRVGKQ